MDEINKYAPLTEAEFIQLRNELAPIGSNLPTHLMSYMWDLCVRIRNRKEPQPCGCASAGGLWLGCINDLREFVKVRDV